MIHDASSRAWGPRFALHDSSEENLRTLGGWLERYGRPLALLYTNKNGLFVISRPVQWQEQLQDIPPRTHFGRAPMELDIEWIARPTPRKPKGASSGCSRRCKTGPYHCAGPPLFGNHVLAGLEPALCGATGTEQRRASQIAARAAATTDSQLASAAHRRFDHTVKCEGRPWCLQREQVCAGLRGAPTPRSSGASTARTGCVFAAATCR